MTIGRLVERPGGGPADLRAPARAVGEAAGREPALGPGLSMGMSEDYAVAVEEGATVVRVGRALFGERPAPGPSIAQGPLRGPRDAPRRGGPGRRRRRGRPAGPGAGAGRPWRGQRERSSA